MAQNYTFNGSLTMSATSASGYTSSMSGSTTINITGVDQIASGRIDCATDADATLQFAFCLLPCSVPYVCVLHLGL